MRLCVCVSVCECVCVWAMSGRGKVVAHWPLRLPVYLVVKRCQESSICRLGTIPWTASVATSERRTSLVSVSEDSTETSEASRKEGGGLGIHGAGGLCGRRAWFSQKNLPHIRLTGQFEIFQPSTGRRRREVLLENTNLSESNDFLDDRKTVIERVQQQGEAAQAGATSSTAPRQGYRHVLTRAM